MTEGGVGKSGRKFLPRGIVTLQRCAIATEFASASGWSAKAAAISACVLKYCSGVNVLGRRGSARTKPPAMQTRASCARKSSRRRNCTGCVATTGSASSPASLTVAATSASSSATARALHFEVVAPRKEVRPCAARPSRRRARCPAGASCRRRRRARRRARSTRRIPSRNQSRFNSARPRCWLVRYARVSHSASRRNPARDCASRSARNGWSRSASCVSQTSQPTIGLTPCARAAR